MKEIFLEYNLTEIDFVWDWDLKKLTVETMSYI